jgi:TolA-binding protein
MMKQIILAISSLALLTLTAGCLKTRNEVTENHQVMQQQTTYQQQATVQQRTTADTGSRLSDIEEQLRYLNGRVEVAENKLGSGNANVENSLKSAQQQNVDQNQKIQILQEALSKMENQIFQLNAELQAVKAEQAGAVAEKSAKQAAAAVVANHDYFEAGQDFFAKKDWKKAILNFQKYRDESPKGKHAAEATYKIGVSFQELGMKEEARTFYDEVTGKYPKSDQARKAKTRLKSLKK